MRDDLKSRDELLAEIRGLRQQLANPALPQPDFIRLVLDTDPNLIFVKDAEGRFLLANRAMADLYGLSPEELVRRSQAGELPGPAELADYQRVEQEVIRTGRPAMLEEQNTRPDGQVRWFHTTKTPLVLANGVTHVLGIAADVTQRKLTLEALRASEERFRNLIEHAADAVFVWDQQGRLVDVNQRACASLERSRQELLELTPAEVANLLGLTGTEDVAGEPVTIQAQQQRKDGATFPVEIRLAQSRTLGRCFTIALVRDMTERLRGEEALRRSNDALQALIAAAPAAIYTLDCDGLMRSWNRAAERMYGWREDEVLGGPPPMLTAETVDEARALRERVLRGETFTGVEACRRRQDGSLIHVSLSAAPLHSAAGQVHGIMAVATDITEAHELREQLRQAQKLEAVGRLAGGIAHDFNNLLTIISGYSELLLGRLDRDHELHDPIRHIQHAGERAATLVRQLLAFSRRQIMIPIAVDLPAMIAGMESRFRPLLGANINLVTRYEPNLGLVLADPEPLEQVLFNLVVNARDAMPAGGTLTIEARNARLGEAYARQHPEVLAGPYVELSVSDTGCGMDERTQALVFEPFFTTKEVGKGTGLGLAAVYGIVKQSGGQVEVVSRPGWGSIFRVYWPMATAMPAVVDAENNIKAWPT